MRKGIGFLNHWTKKALLMWACCIMNAVTHTAFMSFGYLTNTERARVELLDPVFSSGLQSFSNVRRGDFTQQSKRHNLLLRVRRVPRLSSCFRATSRCKTEARFRHQDPLVRFGRTVTTPDHTRASPSPIQLSSSIFNTVPLVLTQSQSVHPHPQRKAHRKK